MFLSRFWSLSRERRASARRLRPYPLTCERLEDRLVLNTTISVDASADRHAIDPRIYGLNDANTQVLSDLNIPFNRSGGNLTSRYNWQQNASNHGSDFFFESITDGPAVAAGLSDEFISDTQAGGAEPSVTVSMVGWVAKLNPGRATTWSFSVAKYGPQDKTDPDTPNPDAGDGIRLDGVTLVQGNDPNDANVPSDVNFQRGWVQHMVNTFGTAGNGGVRYYTLDNEPAIWHETHRDVHPNGAGMDEVRDDMMAYAGMVKDVDPNALTLGPEEFGWAGYFFSGQDLQHFDTGQAGPPPDQAAHGGVDYLPYLLDQLHQNDVATGKRLLDVFTVHYYPQGEEDHATETKLRDEFTTDVTPQTQLLRNRSTRSLWDPSYVDASYIGRIGPDNGIVQLIPRLKDWVDQFYPGTQIGVTEYSWGAPEHMNGATAEADVLGIFGREQGLDLANYFPLDSNVPMPIGSPVFNTFKLYRNYDGAQSTFGNTSVKTTAPNPDNVSAFSAVRSTDGALTVMVVNKQLFDPAHPNATESVTVDLSNFQGTGTAERWQLAAVNGNDQTQSAITHKADVAVAGNTFTVSVPMQSVTLFVLPAAVGVHTPLTVDATYGTGTDPQVVAMGDFDGANGLDLVVTDMSSSGLAHGGTLTVLLNDGTGKFAPAPGSPFTFSNTDEFPEGVTTGKFNADANTDIVVVFNGGYLRVLSGNGDGTFNIGPKVNIVGTNFVTAADFNKDGILDLAVTDFGAGAGNDSLSVLTGNGDGTFTVAQTIDTLSNPEQVIAADLDDDGLLDLSVPNQKGGNAVSIFRNTGAVGGAISFAAVAVNFASGESGPTGQAVGDLNGDGLPDLAVTNVFGDTVSVFLNTSPAQGTISFGPATNLTVGSFPVGVVIGDVDGDGKQDLAVANNGGGGQVTVLPGKGDGTFDPRQDVTLGGQPQIMAADNLNADGLPDLAVAVPTAGGNNVSVLLTKGAAQAVQFSAAAYAVNEEDDSIEITVTRTGSSAAPLTVSYATHDATATAGADYTAAAGMLTFAAGQTTQTLTVDITDDATAEPDETFTVTLSDPTNGATLGTPATATVTIRDNDARIDVEPIDGLVTTEAGGTAAFTVVLASAPADDVTINLRSSNPALGTVDLATLTFTPDNALVPQTVTITGQDDGVADGNHTYAIITDPAVSADPAYNGRNGNDVGVLSVGFLAGNRGTFTDDDGDRYTVQLTGPGGVGVLLHDPDGNGRGSIERIFLQDSASRSSNLRVAVVKRLGNGMVDIGSITGSGLRGIVARTSDLTGSGIDLGDYLGGLTIHDILNGANVTALGSATQKTRVFAHVIDDDSFIELGSGISSLTAARFGVGGISAPSLGTLQIRGDRAAGIPADFQADVSLSGDGIASGRSVLGSVKISGAIEGSDFVVGGNVGSFNVRKFVNSSLFLGNNGELTEGLRLGSFQATGVPGLDEAAFLDSSVMAANIGSVFLKSVATGQPGTQFGVTAVVKMGSVRVGNPAFRFVASKGSPQGIDLDGDGQLDFVVRLG